MTYEFKCEECGNEETKQLTVKEYETIPQYCSKCKGKLKRIYTPTDFILEGTCWSISGYE